LEEGVKTTTGVRLGHTQKEVIYEGCWSWQLRYPHFNLNLSHLQAQSHCHVLIKKEQEQIQINEDKLREFENSKKSFGINYTAGDSNYQYGGAPIGEKQRS
jgi:hypothetical protein